MLALVEPALVRREAELSRLAAALNASGVETLDSAAAMARMEIRDDGVYLDYKTRVGLLALFTPIEEFDRDDPALRRFRKSRTARALVRTLPSKSLGNHRAELLAAANDQRFEYETFLAALVNAGMPLVGDVIEARDKRTDVLPGLFSAWLRGLVELNHAPGVNWLDDKELGLHVDQLIRFYLSDEPIVRSIPGRRLDELDESEALADKGRWVYKPAVGVGGNDVLIGAEKSDEEFAEKIKLVYASGEAGDWIRQEYWPSSKVLDDAVGLRIFAQIDREPRALVSRSGYGRARALSQNDSRTNIAAGAKVIPVVVRETRNPRCPDAF